MRKIRISAVLAVLLALGAGAFVAAQGRGGGDDTYRAVLLIEPRPAARKAGDRHIDLPAMTAELNRLAAEGYEPHLTAEMGNGGVFLIVKRP